MIKYSHKFAKGQKRDHSLFGIKKFNVVNYSRSAINHSNDMINYCFFTTLKKCGFSETI